ncbi:hypothetical protein TNCV_4247241 [Trichonephila clavipes]|nr:hypothetical protein TNCV_4247241 [Trichonephila clavipes]
MNLRRALAARRLFRVPPCREGTIHLQTYMFSPVLEPRPNGTEVSASNRYTGWTDDRIPKPVDERKDVFVWSLYGRRVKVINKIVSSHRLFRGYFKAQLASFLRNMGNHLSFISHSHLNLACAVDVFHILFIPRREIASC